MMLRTKRNRARVKKQKSKSPFSRLLRHDPLEERTLLSATLVNTSFNSFGDIEAYRCFAQHHSGYEALTHDTSSQQSGQGTVVLKSPGRPITDFYATFNLGIDDLGFAGNGEGMSWGYGGFTGTFG